MDDNFNDYFTDENVPDEEPQVHQETEQEREDREIKEATIERRGASIKMLLALVIIVMALFLGWWVWQYYFHPYRTSQERGWIMKVTNEGTIFKTFEAEMISEGYIEDTIGVMKCDVDFSITTDSLVRIANQQAGDGQRIILTYNEYKGRVMWRGNSKRVATKIEIDSMRPISNPHWKPEEDKEAKE